MKSLISSGILTYYDFIEILIFLKLQEKKKMNGTRDSGFSETIADETNFDSLDFNPEKIESISGYLT